MPPSISLSTARPSQGRTPPPFPAQKKILLRAASMVPGAIAKVSSMPSRHSCKEFVKATATRQVFWHFGPNNQIVCKGMCRGRVPCPSSADHVSCVFFHANAKPDCPPSAAQPSLPTALHLGTSLTTLIPHRIFITAVISATSKPDIGQTNLSRLLVSQKSGCLKMNKAMGVYTDDRRQRGATVIPEVEIF